MMLQKIHLTPQEIEEGLTDENVNIRCAWAECLDFTPTPEQIERGLTDSARSVQWRWIKRSDFTPTAAQTVRGFTADADSIGRRYWAERPNVFLSLADLAFVLEHIDTNNLTSLKEEFEVLLRSQAEAAQLSASVDETTVVRACDTAAHRTL